MKQFLLRFSFQCFNTYDNDNYITQKTAEELVLRRETRGCDFSKISNYIINVEVVVPEIRDYKSVRFRYKYEVC